MKYFLWILVGVVGIGGCNIVSNYLGTAGKLATAPSRVINKTLDTDNIINNYEWYYDVDAAFTAKLNQIKQFKGFLDGEDDKNEIRMLRMEMGAVQQSCRDLATKYNNNSQKLNKKYFKGWSLPEVLNINNCEV